MTFSVGFPKLCAAKETEMCRERFMLWQKSCKMFVPWWSRLSPS